MSERDIAAELDALLQARAEQLARSARPLIAARASALCLELGSDRVLLPSDAAAAVMPLTSITPIPMAEAHVAGLTARRGRVLPVFHLRVLLGLPLRDLPETSRIVVLAGAGDPALAVDGVSEDAWPTEAELLPPSETVSARSRELLRGVTADGRMVLDPSALLSSPLLSVEIAPHLARRGRE